MQNRTELYKNIILPLIVRHLPQAKIILYGSRARGDFHEGADIDIALDVGKPIDREILDSIMGDLKESSLPIAFDVVDIAKVSENMRNNIIKDRIVWKER